MEERKGKIMEELNIAFNNYMDEFKKLTTQEKREELIDSIKELIAGLQYLASQEQKELHYIKNREILDLNNEEVSEDDFIEAAFVYMEVAKNMLGEYLQNKTN